MILSRHPHPRTGDDPSQRHPRDQPAITGGAIPPAALERLRDHARHAHGAFAPATERALRADIAIFTAWCAEVGAAPPPATPETVAAFNDAMAAEKAPATIRRYVSSIASFHRAAGFSAPSEAMEVKLALKRMHGGKGRAQAQAAPLNRQHADKMLAAAGDRRATFGTARCSPSPTTRWPAAPSWSRSR
jgi:hypothetical protein